MPIKFSKDVESDLVMRFAEGFQESKLRYNFFWSSDFRWADEYIDELSDDTKTKLERFVGENAFSKIIYTELERRYLKMDIQQKLSKGMPLTATSIASDPIKLSKEILEIIKSIPFRYRLTAALPSHFSEPILECADDCYELPSGITIARGHSLPGYLPVHSEHPRIDETLFSEEFGGDENIPRELDEKRFYFSMPAFGYAVDGSSSTLGRTFEDHLRAFYGAGMAIGLLGYGYAKDQTLPYVMIHSENERNLVETERLEEDFLKNESRCSTKKLVSVSGQNSNKHINRMFSRIGTIFNDNVDCRKLFTACIWNYRAKVNQRPLDSLLESTIAIEVMLGDRKVSDGLGLSNLLGNRCAFLLGTTSSEREEIMSSFQRVYQLRSSIVHEGRHSLVAKDRKTVELAQTLCARIISKELDVRASPLSG